MATIPIIQLLRNNNIYSSRDAARSALEGQKNNVPDGGVILARYSGTTGEQMIIKTLAGFVSNISTPENATVTIIDVEGADKNVQDAITSAINRLNQKDTAVDGQYVSSVSEANGIITVTRTPLPSVEKHAPVGEAVTAVTQTNGKIGVEYGRINALNVSVDDSMNRFHSDNVDGALNHLFTSLNEAMGSVGMIIDGKINALNSGNSDTSEHITVGVDQKFGRITSVTVHERNIASASLLGTISDTKDNKTAFGRIAKEVADREAAIEDLSTSSTVTLESVEGTEGFLKVYTIKQGGNEVGTINIPKDLVVTSGSVVKGTWDGNTFTENVSGSGTALKLVIANQEAPVYINTLDLVKDHTGGNGIAISNTNEISVVRDSNSEGFLTVSESGVKLSGVQAAINKANTKVAKDSSADKITLSDSTAADGSVTYTIGQNDIASEAALTAHTANTVVHVTQEDKDKWNTPTDLSNYYTKEKVDEKDAAINATIEAYGHVTSQALNDLGTRMDDYGQVTSQALNDLGTKFGDYYTKTEVDTAISNVDVTSQLQNYYTKTEVDSKDATINATIEALSSDTKNKIDAEASARQEADNTLQGNINNVNSTLTTHTADNVVHITQAEREKWNTPTNLSNYYTKEKVDEKDAAINSTIESYGQVTSQALNDLGTRMDDYGKVTSQSLNDLSTKFGDYYTKTEVDSKDATLQTALDALEARIAELETKFLNMENNGLQAGEY